MMEDIFAELANISVFTLEQQLGASAWNIEFNQANSEKKMVFVDGGPKSVALVHRMQDANLPALRASQLRNLRIGVSAKKAQESGTLIVFEDKPSPDIRVEGQILVGDDVLNDNFQQRDRAIRTLSGLAACAARAAFEAIERAGILSLLGSLRPNSIIVRWDGEAVVIPSKRAKNAVHEALTAKTDPDAKQSLGKLVKRALKALTSAGGEWSGSPYYCEVFPTADRQQPVFVMPLLTDLNEGQANLFGIVVHGRVEPLASDAIKSIFNLTPAEANVARRALMGQRPKLIAQGMQVSAETVRTYLSRIYQKMNVEDRGELIATMTEMATMIGEPVKSDLSSLPRTRTGVGTSSLTLHAPV